MAVLPTSLGCNGKCGAPSEVWGSSFSLLVGALDQESGDQGSGDQGLENQWNVGPVGFPWGPQVSHLEVVHLLVSPTSQPPVAHWLLTLAPRP